MKMAIGASSTNSQRQGNCKKQFRQQIPQRARKRKLEKQDGKWNDRERNPESAFAGQAPRSQLTKRPASARPIMVDAIIDAVCSTASCMASEGWRGARTASYFQSLAQVFGHLVNIHPALFPRPGTR